MSALTQRQTQRALAALRRDIASRLSDVDLSTELDERLTAIHMHEADLRLGDSATPPDILQNGIAYELHWVEILTREMNRRVHANRAAQTGVRDPHAVSDSQIAAVRAIDIVEALQSFGIDLHKGSQEWHARCPLHDDSSPSFSVSQERGVWFCFGCREGGDLLTFIEIRFNLGFVEALRFAETMLAVSEAA